MYYFNHTAGLESVEKDALYRRVKKLIEKSYLNDAIMR